MTISLVYPPYVPAARLSVVAMPTTHPVDESLRSAGHLSSITSFGLTGSPLVTAGERLLMAAAPLQPQASAVESFLPPRSGSVTLWSAPIWPGSIPTQLTGLPSRHAAAGFRCPDFLWLCCCSAVGDADADAAFPRSIAACAFPPQPPGNLRHDCWPRLVTALRRRPGRGCDDAVCSAPAKRRRQPTNGSIAHFVRAHRSEARRPQLQHEELP